MAAFPEDTEISVSKLIKLWVAEGFLTPPQPPQTIERVAENSLTMLIDRNLISIRGNSSDGRIKTCGIHDSLLELAKEEAEKAKFFYSITTSQTEKIEGGAVCQRRVSVHDTILMCRKQVYHSTKSIKYARSLIYVDPHYHYPLPFCLTFDLLRVLDAYTVYHIEFPIEYIKLVHLRYLSLTYNGKLPPSISKLKNLQVLIVRRQPKIIVVGISFLPEEIWDMPQLRHLLFTESELPYPCLEENSLLLENLQTLSNVSATSCTKEVLRNMPNLKKLGMWIDKRGAIGFHLDGLNQLESFKFTVLKPIPTSRIEFQPNLFFPETLRKLSLSGCGLPWEDMEVIAKLPNLEVLKLRELAFQGEEWCPTYVFYKLKFLVIEYLDLQRWETDGSHYPRLDHLILRNCYALEGIPLEIGYLGHLELIELVECSPDAVDAAECIKEEQENIDNNRLQVRIFSSLE